MNKRTVFPHCFLLLTLQSIWKENQFRKRISNCWLIFKLTKIKFVTVLFSLGVENLGKEIATAQTYFAHPALSESPSPSGHASLWSPKLTTLQLSLLALPANHTNCPFSVPLKSPQIICIILLITLISVTLSPFLTRY